MIGYLSQMSVEFIQNRPDARPRCHQNKCFEANLLDDGIDRYLGVSLPLGMADRYQSTIDALRGAAHSPLMICG